MLNNKGQSLILFIVVLPVLLFILILVIDIGKVIVLKQELFNISEIVIDYGLDNFNNDKIVDEMNSLVLLNKNDIDTIDIKLEDNKLYIKFVDNVEGSFSSLINLDIFRVESNMVGYIDSDNRKRIERVNG